jgi:neutral ceramidase
MNAGFSKVEITPNRNMPLCGFAARCNASFLAVDDPIFVQALVVNRDGVTVAVLSYDLLALGETTTRKIQSALATVARDLSPKWILCTTHTHSAPAAVPLRGCGDMQDDYQDFLVAKSVAAAQQAIAGLKPAVMRSGRTDLSGQSYNRRRILDDGRVSMARQPEGKVMREGPLLTGLRLLRLDDSQGNGIGGIVSWSCHPVMVGGPNLTADYPGELCRRLSAQFALPFLFLQGAGANTNPCFDKMTRDEMLRHVDNMMSRVGHLAWSCPESDPGLAFVSETVNLAYDRPFSANALKDMRAGMASIAKTGDGPPVMMSILADILNVKPGSRPDKAMSMHIAAIIRDWSAETLPWIESGGVGSVPLDLAVLRLGHVTFCFVAAEPFAETAIRLTESCPNDNVTLVGYGAPLVGYLPTDQALDEGGYEADYAYRFYDHPGPFVKGSEPRVVETLRNMIGRCASRAPS